LNGPKNLGQILLAVESSDGTNEWWVNGEEVSKPKVDDFRLKTLTLSFVVNRRIWKLHGLK